MAPLFVVTVIVALPAAFAVTTPEVDTVATLVLFDDQVTDLSVALDGVTVATRVWVSPTSIVSEVLFMLTPVTGMTRALTVIMQEAVLPPSLVVTVIVAVPAFFAVTTPEPDTVATVVLLEDHVTFWFVALDGAIVAIRLCVSPSVIDRAV